VAHASLLRASGQTSGVEIDARVATGASDDPDGGVAGGAVLRRYAHAIVAEPGDLDAARVACVEALGATATCQAAAVVASFDGINRVADATGIGVDAEMYERGADSIIESLDLERIRGDRA
jgi:hypothetical protein